MAERALLLLIGGRQIPNLLMAQSLQPNVIVPIASPEALREGDAWQRVAPALRQLCPIGLAEPLEVDAFDIEQIREMCRSAFSAHPEAEWFVNVTCGTTIMSIGAYEVGREYGASIWYLNTATRRTVVLAGPKFEDDVYRLTVKDYMDIYGRAIMPTKPEPPPETQIEFARQLAVRPLEAMDFRDRLERAGIGQGKYMHPRVVTLKSLPIALRDFCALAENAGMLSGYRLDTLGDVQFELSHHQLWTFINGLWLEVYAWIAANEIMAGNRLFFDDHRYALCIPSVSGGRNELDLALTYTARLIIAECKTEAKPFETSHLDQLRAIAGMVGGSFVGCIFIASKPAHTLDRNQQAAFDHFCVQARERRIVVVTGEQLGNLSEILKREAVQPTYPPT